MSVGIGRIRHALGDGATEAQAKRVHALLSNAGLLQNASAPAPARLVGVAEIAQLAGVTSGAVCQWKLPEPIVTLKQGRVWDADVIESFQRERGVG